MRMRWQRRVHMQRIKADTLTPITLRVNDRQYRSAIEPRMLLSDFLREDCGLAGTHVGCEHGVCGACTVMLVGQAVRSCLMFAVQCAGAAVVSVEGLAGPDGGLHPLQEAFKRHHGLQCGFCTPGFLMLAVPIYRGAAGMSDEELRKALGGQLCRCTGYAGILAAVRAAAAIEDER